MKGIKKMANIVTKIMLLNGTREDWEGKARYVLAKGEAAVEFVDAPNDGVSTKLTAVKIKVGDGFTAYEDLPYVGQEYEGQGVTFSADGKSILLDNNVLKLFGFDNAADGTLAQVKVDIAGNRTLQWVSIEEIANGDGNTTYTFEDGTDGTFTVTSSDGVTIEIDTGARELIEASLDDFYNKEAINGKVADLEEKISAIPKFSIEVVSELPTSDIKETTVYLVPDNDATTSDVYKEYIYVKVSDTEYKWELLGKQTLDLTGYATTTYVDDKVAEVTEQVGLVADNVATIFAKLNNVEENAQANVLEGVKVNGEVLPITDKVVDIPAADVDTFGVVKLGNEFKTNAESGALEVKELNVNKLVQTEGEVLVFDCGTASQLTVN